MENLLMSKVVCVRTVVLVDFVQEITMQLNAEHVQLVGMAP